MQAVSAALGSFSEAPASPVLRALTHSGAAATLAAPLDDLVGAADWEEAKAEGRVVPRPVRTPSKALALQ